MVQEQLVEYVSSQLKLGVSRDAIKAALIGAGWATADVEDTLKKLEGAAKPAAPVSGIPASVTPVGTSSNISSKPASSPAGSPSSIRVSDLVSASPSSTPFTSSSSRPAASPATDQNKKPAQGQSSLSMSNLQNRPLDLARPKTAVGAMQEMPVKKRNTPFMMIVGIVLMLGLAAFAVFFYFQNNSLAQKVAALGTTSADVASQIATLTGQVQTLEASNTALTSENASIAGENLVLRTNLSFAAIPPASSNAPATETVSISGTITAGKSFYTLTTQYGVVVLVKNAQDPKVAAAIAPLVKSGGSATLTGTHVPGSQYITVTEVNGVALQ
jgi:hypothetical protein